MARRGPARTIADVQKVVRDDGRVRHHVVTLECGHVVHKPPSWRAATANRIRCGECCANEDEPTPDLSNATPCWVHTPHGQRPALWTRATEADRPQDVRWEVFIGLERKRALVRPDHVTLPED